MALGHEIGAPDGGIDRGKRTTAVTGPIWLTIATGVREFPGAPSEAFTGLHLAAGWCRALESVAESFGDEAEMPSTATIAAIPMATPTVDNAVRSRLVRSPNDPTRSRSVGRSLEEAQRHARSVAGLRRVEDCRCHVDTAESSDPSLATTPSSIEICREKRRRRVRGHG